MTSTTDFQQLVRDAATPQGDDLQAQAEKLEAAQAERPLTKEELKIIACAIIDGNKDDEFEAFAFQIMSTRQVKSATVGGNFNAMCNFVDTFSREHVGAVMMRHMSESED